MQKTANGEEQLGHYGIGSADSCLRAHHQPCGELLVGAVEYNEILSADVLEIPYILHADRGIFHADDIGIFKHLPEKGMAERDPRKLRNVVDYKRRITGGA